MNITTFIIGFVIGGLTIYYILTPAVAAAHFRKLRDGVESLYAKIKARRPKPELKDENKSNPN